MPTNQKIAPSSSNVSNSSAAEMIIETPEVLSINSFKLKPAGTGATRNTLVENDSLSSYSWPEEASRKSEEIQAHVTRGDGIDESHSDSSNKPGQVSIDINNIHECTPEASFVEVYMSFMYWSCVSPFNPTKNNDGDESSLYWWALNVIQKICFTITSSLSLLQAFFWVKYYAILNFADGNLENFIKMAFFIMSACTQFYFVYQFIRLQPKLRKMITSLRDLHQFQRQNSTDCKPFSSSFTYVIILGLSSLLVSLIEPIWVIGTKGWTFEKTLLYHSSETAQGLFLWSSDDLTNATWNKNMYETFEKDLSLTNTILGVLGIIIYFCTSAQMEAINNVMLMNAQTLKHEIKLMEKNIRMDDNDETNITLAGFLRENGEWAHIRMIMHATNANNDAFDPLMRYKHVDNLTLFVYFIMNAFDGEFALIYTACLVYVIVKTSCMYRIATEASSLNENATRCICRLGWKSKDKAFLEKVPIMLTEIKKNPIGIGNGQFMINESFLYRFLGSVGSVFILQAQSRESTAK